MTTPHSRVVFYPVSLRKRQNKIETTPNDEIPGTVNSTNIEPKNVKPCKVYIETVTTRGQPIKKQIYS